MKRIRHRLMFTTEPTSGEPAGGGSTTPDPDTAGQSTADGAQNAPQDPTEPSETDWQGKFKGQQKVNRDLETKLNATRDELAALKAAAEGRAAEHKAEQERAKVQAEAVARANERIRKSEVRAAAAKLLKDPADALLYIDLDQFEVSDDGEVDASAVTEAVEALVKSKPYLAAEGGTGPVIHSPTSNREGSTGKRQWTKADLKGKTPEQINAAKSEGLLNSLLGIE
jgi:hypothetical protein